jgi:hypothetical protein
MLQKKGDGRGLEFPGPVKSGFGAILASTRLQPVGHFHVVGPTDNRTSTDRLATVVQRVATGFNQSQPTTTAGDGLKIKGFIYLLQ